MITTAFLPGRLTELALAAQSKFGVIVLVAAALAVVGSLAPNEILQAAFFAASAALALLCSVFALLGFWHRRKARIALSIATAIIDKDYAPGIIAEEDGQLMFTNAAARARLEPHLEDTLAGTLSKTVANPAALIFRLQSRAATDGAAREDVVTAKGRFRLSVLRADASRFIWRIEDAVSPQTDAYDVKLPVVVTGPQNDIVSVNAAARQLIGQPVKSVDRLFDRVPPELGAECTITTRNGSTRVFVLEAESKADRRVLVLLPPVFNNAAADRDEWSVFENLPVSLMKIAADGTVHAHNRVASDLLGDMRGGSVHLSDVMEGLGRSISDWLTETLNSRSGQSSEFLRLKRMDKEVYVQVTLNRVEENGRPVLIAVLNDATELKTLEAQFVQSQKMQAIGQLAGGVAHDFNNLLTAISGHCDLLLLRHDQGDPDFSDLVQINQNANRAAALVGQLLAFSRKQTLRPETLDVRDTLSDLTHLLNRLVGEKVTLTLSHDPDLHPIRADKRQLEQVLMNLVVNARDAMPQGGEIRIDTKCLELKEALARDRVSVPAGRYVTVRVSDEGVGIPKDKLQKVFEPFFTTKRTGEGTGLGLSTAYGIIKQTGGYIFVDSTLGSGTCFTLYLPVLENMEQAPAPQKRAPVKSSGKHGDGVILLVEDEAPVRAFASRALRLRGYTVLEADSAEAALKTLEDVSLNVDVFVTDVVMPGMDGPSWVREAMKTRPDVRVVFVSGYAEDSFGEAQTKIPNSVFLPKPFSLSDLTETVHAQLH
ncbi:MAG: ATP-binding protein [Pseudomonadota bacterium]